MTNRKIEWIAFVLGVLGGAACTFVVYPVSQSAKIGGFLLPAFAWERLESGAWADFVSPLTLPMLAVDFAVGFWFSRVIARKVGRRYMAASELTEGPPTRPAR